MRASASPADEEFEEDGDEDSHDSEEGIEQEDGGNAMDDDDELMISEEEDEGVDLMSALDNLDKFVSKLSTVSSSKRKADDEETGGAPVKEMKSKKKARFVQDVTEAGTAEGEYGARPSGEGCRFFRVYSA